MQEQRSHLSDDESAIFELFIFQDIQCSSHGPYEILCLAKSPYIRAPLFFALKQSCLSAVAVRKRCLEPECTALLKSECPWSQRVFLAGRPGGLSFLSLANGTRDS